MNLQNPHQQRERRSIRSSRDADRARSAVRTGDSAEPTKHGEAMRERLDALAGDAPVLRVDRLIAGYGSKETVSGVDLRLGRGQLLCLLGPNGAGKSTILHAIFGLADIRGGRVEVGGRNVTRLGPNAKLREAGIACVLRGSSLFPDMTVERNLWLGGYLMRDRADARQAAERIFERYPWLASRRNDPARALTSGERRLLELARALVMQPRLLLIDEPSMGLGAAFSDRIFEMLHDLRDRDELSILMVEQNAKRALALADIGCVVACGEIAMVGTGAELLGDPAVGRLFLGG